MAGIAVISVLHLQELANCEERQSVEHEGNFENLLAGRIVKERVGVAWLDDAERSEHHDRQEADQYPAHLRLGRKRLDLLLQALARANDFREPSDYYCQRAAYFRLHPHRDDQ